MKTLSVRPSDSHPPDLPPRLQAGEAVRKFDRPRCGWGVLVDFFVFFFFFIEEKNANGKGGRKRFVERSEKMKTEVRAEARNEKRKER